MRFLQVIFAVNILLTLVLSVFLIKGDYTLAFSDVLDYLNLVFEAMSFWLIWQRKRRRARSSWRSVCSTSSSARATTWAGCL